MKTYQLPIVAVAGLALITTGPAQAHVRHHTSHHAHPAAIPSGAKLMATLTGAAEVPAGDADASGTFSATINVGQTQLCYELKATGLATPTAAHIHAGAAGQNGGPVVMLAAPANGTSKACVAVTTDLAKKLIDNPQGYYVNVHNAEFPGGGLRGQLSK